MSKPARFRHRMLKVHAKDLITNAKEITRGSFRRGVDWQDRVDVEDFITARMGTYFKCRYEGKKAYFFEYRGYVYIFSKEV